MTSEQIKIGYRILQELQGAEEVKSQLPKIEEIEISVKDRNRLATIRKNGLSYIEGHRIKETVPEEILRLWEDELKIFLERIAYQVDQVIYQKNRELQDLGIVNNSNPIEL